MHLSSKVLLAVPFLPLISGNLKGCVDQFVLGKDYFEDKVEPLNSKSWSVSYRGTYKIATNLAANETYLLYQCGTEPPEDQIDGLHAAVVPVPLEDVGLLYTTMIPFIELLGKRKSISAFFGPASWVSSPCLSKLLDDGDVEEVIDPYNETLIQNVPLELPSFIGQYGDVAFNTRFRISLTEEDENLAAFEWLKFYSLFFNLESAANEIFNTVKERYDCAEQNAASLTCDGEKKPVVLWGAYSAYCGGWDVAKCPNYYCEFAEACSATLLHSKEGSIKSEFCGATYMTTEEFVEFGKDADYWIHPSPDFSNTLADFKDELKDFVSVKNEQVFDTEGIPGAWFEQRLAEPDVILQDFCAVVGRTNTAAPMPHERAWFRNVFTESVGNPGNCEDPSAALITKGTQCAAVPSDVCGDSVDDSSDPTGATAKPKMLLATLVATLVAFTAFF